jgi:PTS system nitrogen regulatory IIA component
MISLSSLLPPEAVLAHFAPRSKKQALKMLAAKAAWLTGLAEREIHAVLTAREELGSTAMGHGVCIPHGRFGGLSAPRAMFARLEQPIEFAAPDGRPVDIVFLLLTPMEANTEHLKALALITRLLRDGRQGESLRATDDASLQYQLLLNYARDAA